MDSALPTVWRTPFWCCPVTRILIGTIINIVTISRVIRKVGREW